MQNDIAEIKLRAERRAGELLAEMEKAKGTQGRIERTDDGGYSVKPPSEDEPPTLSDLGISKSQSHRWQLEAEVSEEDFERQGDCAKVGGSRQNGESLEGFAICDKCRR